LRVLITGGAGYIGTHTIVEFLSANYSVSIIDNFSNSKPGGLARVKELTKKDFRFSNIDITNFEALKKEFEVVCPDLVVHIAGLKKPYSQINDELAYYTQNVLGTFQLLRAMKHVECNQILFSSSAIVYGPSQISPHSEIHPTSPVSLYGKTKVIVEELLESWAKNVEKRSAIALRYFNPIGAHPSGIIGEDSLTEQTNLVPRIIEVASGITKELKVFGENYNTRDGTGERDYIHIVDLANAHLAAADFLNKMTGFKTYNVGTGSGATVREMVGFFEKISGCKIPVKVVGERTGEIPSSIADVTKIRKEIGWVSRMDVFDACKTAWKWKTNNSSGY
jgi:UDP-glucose 4-epimerase